MSGVAPTTPPELLGSRNSRLLGRLRPGGLFVALLSTVVVFGTIAWVIVFPKRQRTYVASNAIGLLLKYSLESSGHPERPGLELLRVQWTSHTANLASHTAAKRMGLREEGVLRWKYVIPEGMEGNGIPLQDDDPKSPQPGSDSLIFSMCADDWESGGREHVRRMIDRRQ